MVPLLLLAQECGCHIGRTLVGPAQPPTQASPFSDSSYRSLTAALPPSGSLYLGLAIDSAELRGASPGYSNRSILAL